MFSYSVLSVDFCDILFYLIDTLQLFLQLYKTEACMQLIPKICWQNFTCVFFLSFPKDRLQRLPQVIVAAEKVIQMVRVQNELMERDTRTDRQSKSCTSNLASFPTYKHTCATHNSSIRSEEQLTLEISALETLHIDGQFTLSTQLIQKLSFNTPLRRSTTISSKTYSLYKYLTVLL